MSTRLAALALTLLLVAPLPADDRKPDFGPVRDLIRARLVEQGVPSVAVAVARDGAILWEEGFGWADREKRVPATEHTMYSLASISKPITATALMVLKQRGKVDLDRPVNDYLGDAKLRARVGDAKDATVRRIANHTSGLHVHYQFFYEDEPYRRPPMDETIRRYGQLVWPPGERYSYSNLGYGVLDYVIARVSGKSYADFLREEVFLPLGMTRASVGIGPGLEPFAASRYGPDGLPIPFYDFDHPGGSAVYCSAHDLVRFGLFHLKAHLPDQKAILSDENLAVMQTPAEKDGPASGYGVGWAVGNGRVQHTGGMGGVSTRLTLIPSEKLAVVVLCNASSNLPSLVEERILAQLLPGQGAKPDSRRSGKQESSQETGAISELKGEWRGSVHTYRGEVPLTLWFKDSGDVHAKLGDQLKTLLNDVRFRDNRLFGRMAGDLGTDDANRRPYYLHVEMVLRGQVLNGAVSAISRPGKRAGNALSHWVELKNVGEP